ncbi:MAG TPA: type I-D CRISPR-associated helicase Cas3' [Ktedonobacteraceae bacterium]|nr:type I-D CRISPR-associated helicase Cas3' [Ktedonobacteraceae bacterium]
MSSIRLLLRSQHERVWKGQNPSSATFPEQRGIRPLYHQWRTYHATEPLIVNTYNTGTGKTRAALLRLLKRAQDIGFNALESSEHNALLIAPTNELLAQHARDAEEFCKQNGLPYRVVSISRATIEQHMHVSDFSEGELRRGAALHYILQNPRKVNPEGGKKATLFVVNPDIFYYAFYCLYAQFDRIPLFQDIFTLCNYIIIDEFHYYNPKQLANFLFFMSLSNHYGYLGKSTNRQFCLLTATPNERVERYLEKLNIGIGWIKPENAPADELKQTDESAALTPTQLEVYSIDEMKEGLLTLAREKRAGIADWLARGEDGAIISSALWRINQVYYDLRASNTLSTELMGRLTGAESRGGRVDAKARRLILATPTVDIGYNFDRLGKTRQNIDFLLLDARSGDEFIQRLGRAGRVLGKEQQTIASRVLAITDTKFYKALQPYDGQTLSRVALRKLAEENLPARNALYSYIKSGAIAEAFLPIYRLESMTSTQNKPDIEAIFDEMQQLFAADTKLTYKKLRFGTRKYIERAKDYGGLVTVPRERRECLAACKDRVVHEQNYRESQNKGWKGWSSEIEAYNWLQQDLRCYFLEKARFSFREDFQPPLALVGDTKNLLSSESVALYDALHIVKNYKVEYFDSPEKWQHHLQLPLPEGAKDALIYCDLRELLPPDERLQIGLKLSVGEYRRIDWEEEGRFAYHPTALYGLEVTALNNHHGLPAQVRTMFSERYIPAFVAAKGSRTATTLWSLQRQAQFIPYSLQVMFGDGSTHDYVAVLGTMALLVWSEIPYKDIARDRRKAQSEDECPMIF